MVCLIFTLFLFVFQFEYLKIMYISQVTDSFITCSKSTEELI